MLWSAIFLVFLWLEIHSITVEQKLTQQEKEHSGCLLLNQFEALRDEGTTTLRAIQDNSKRQLDIFNQVQRRADINLGEINIEGHWDYPSAFTLLLNYSNSGDTARNLVPFARAYIGDLDGSVAARTIGPRFEDNWRSYAKDRKPVPFLSSDARQMHTEITNPGFSDQEIFNLSMNKTAALYIMTRIRYRDQIGIWELGRCEVTRRPPETGKPYPTSAAAAMCPFGNYPARKINEGSPKQ